MKFDLYDFDGTIYDGDSGVDLILFSLKKVKKQRKRIFKMLWYGLLYILHLTSKTKMKSVMFSFVEYVDDLDKFVLEFWESHECKLKKFWLNKKSHGRDIIISASGYFWLQYIADKYKVYDLFATTYDTKTGEVVGLNCHGKEKVNMFYEKYPNGIIDKMYTDSKNDEPLIEEAKYGYLVKKDVLYNYYEYKPNVLVRFWRWGWGIYHKNEEMWNYLIVGGLTTLLCLGTKFLMLKTFLDQTNGLELQIAEILSWLIALIFAFVCNKLIVFKSKGKSVIKELAEFASGRIFTQLIQMLIMFIFVTKMKLDSDMWVLVFSLICQIMQIVLNYFISKFIVFKKK